MDKLKDKCSELASATRSWQVSKLAECGNWNESQLQWISEAGGRLIQGRTTIDFSHTGKSIFERSGISKVRQD
jgi:hypothetical protein